MSRIVNGLKSLILGFLGKSGVTVTNNSDAQKTPRPEPLKPNYPKLNPQVYLEALEKEVGKVCYISIDDNPKTVENERRTFCNFFVREVCKWFGWTNFESPDRDQAGEITRYMRSHPQQWQKLAVQDGPDYDKAAQLASEGCLIVAAQEAPTPPPTGHVAVITPQGGTIYSPSWSKTVPYAANVGGKNWCGKPLSQAFKTEPELFLFLGN